MDIIYDNSKLPRDLCRVIYKFSKWKYTYDVSSFCGVITVNRDEYFKITMCLKCKRRIEKIVQCCICGDCQYSTDHPYIICGHVVCYDSSCLPRFNFLNPYMDIENSWLTNGTACDCD